MANQIVKQTPLCVEIKTHAPPEIKLLTFIFCLISILLVLFFKDASYDFYIFLATLFSINICLAVCAFKGTIYEIDRSQGVLLIRKHFLISAVKIHSISNIKKIFMIYYHSYRGGSFLPYLVLKSGKRIQLDYWLEKDSIDVMNAYLNNS